MSNRNQDFDRLYRTIQAAVHPDVARHGYATLASQALNELKDIYYGKSSVKEERKIWELNNVVVLAIDPHRDNQETIRALDTMREMVFNVIPFHAPNSPSTHSTSPVPQNPVGTLSPSVIQTAFTLSGGMITAILIIILCRGIYEPIIIGSKPKTTSVNSRQPTDQVSIQGSSVPRNATPRIQPTFDQTGLRAGTSRPPTAIPSPARGPSHCSETIRVAADSKYIVMYSRIPTSRSDAVRFDTGMLLGRKEDGYVRVQRLVRAPWDRSETFIWALITVRGTQGWVHAEPYWTEATPNCIPESYPSTTN